MGILSIHLRERERGGGSIYCTSRFGKHTRVNNNGEITTKLKTASLLEPKLFIAIYQQRISLPSLV